MVIILYPSHYASRAFRASLPVAKAATWHSFVVVGGRWEQLAQARALPRVRGADLTRASMVAKRGVANNLRSKGRRWIPSTCQLGAPWGDHGRQCRGPGPSTCCARKKACIPRLTGVGIRDGWPSPENGENTEMTFYYQVSSKRALMLSKPAAPGRLDISGILAG